MLNFQQPTAVVDIEKVRKNIRRMKQRMDRAGVKFRPHFKTHQSSGIAEVFAREGIHSITVSSITMAHYFAKHGWNDITIAFPLNIREIDRIRALPQDTTPGLLISDAFTTEYPFPDDLLKKAVFWIELDTGHHRSGFPIADFVTLSAIIKRLDKTGAHLQGFLFHDGHTYPASTTEDISRIRFQTLALIAELKAFLNIKYPGRNFLFSGGDTPSCSLDLPMDGIDEMRPGNFVFYDLQQLALGACQPHDIALSVFCPVVASYPDQRRAIIYGGSIHLSKDKMSVDSQTIYGMVCSEKEQDSLHPYLPGRFPLVSSLSQEHGVITGSVEQIARLKPGNLARVIPVHSCLVVSNMPQLVSVDGMVFETMGMHSINF